MAKKKTQAKPRQSKAWAELKTAYREVDPKACRGRHKNARYMDAPVFKRLVENVRTDGRLTSVPLIYGAEPKRGNEIISGHHRIEAAIKAGLESITIEVILTKCSEERLTALQLSHNSLTGKDNQSVLLEMFEPLELDARMFSGITDDDFGDAPSVDLAGMSVGSIQSEEVRILFLPGDRQHFEDALLRAVEKRGSGKVKILAASYKDFDRFFDAVVDIKNLEGIINSGLALRRLSDLAMKQLALEQKPKPQPSKGNGGAKTKTA